MDVCFFNSISQFPAHKEDTIDTVQFLKASEGLVWLIDQFGLGFDLVKNDLNGNIEKLQKKYYENTNEHRCLMRMLLLEYQRGDSFAIESLLWLRRGLRFMAEFLSGFLQNEEKNNHHENLTPLLRKAYESTLKQYHNFFIQIAFKVLCNKCPNRRKFLNILGYERINDEEVFISILRNYLNNLQGNLNVLKSFCQNNNIEPHH